MKQKIEAFISKWASHKFSTGCDVGEDYVRFQNEFRRLLKLIAEDAGYTLYLFNKNHYCFSCVLQNKETKAFVYVSISDVRCYLGHWYSQILYRTMSHEKDWTGGANQYSSLVSLSENLRALYH